MKRIVDFSYFKEIRIKEPLVLVNPQSPGGFLRWLFGFFKKLRTLLIYQNWVFYLYIIVVII
jgi:hypothetical protein